jgi:hypothetical protein
MLVPESVGANNVGAVRVAELVGGLRRHRADAVPRLRLRRSLARHGGDEKSGATNKKPRAQGKRQGHEETGNDAKTAILYTSSFNQLLTGYFF